jgi:hypothetical protein
MSLRFLSQEGQQIGGCYNNALIPAEYFRDDLAAFLVRENFAAILNSASDKEKAKIKMHGRYWGCSMPHDSIGELLLSHHMAKHVVAQNKQTFDQLKAYTGAVVERVSSKNSHSDHNRRHNYPGNQGAQDLYASMYATYEELQGLRSSWAREGEEIEEKFNPTANTDDPLFTLGSSNFMEGTTGDQQEHCLRFAQVMTKLITSFLTYASGIVARPNLCLQFSRLKTATSRGIQCSQRKIQLVFERLWEIRKHHKVRGDGLLAQAAFLSAACTQRWSTPRIDKVTLFAHVADPKLEALAARLGSSQDPFTMVERLDKKYKKGEKTVSAIERQLEEMKKKSGSPGDPKAVSDLRALIESHGAEIAKIKKSAADSRRDKDKHMRETWQRHNPDGNPDGDGNTKGGRRKGGKNTTAPGPAPAQATATAATAAADNG